MEKTYLIKSLDKKPITRLTELEMLRVSISHKKDFTLLPGHHFILEYNKKDIPNPDGVNTPAIVMYIDAVDYRSNGEIIVTDETGRKYIFEEL
jgi:hypothetical protein